MEPNWALPRGESFQHRKGAAPPGSNANAVDIFLKSIHDTLDKGVLESVKGEIRLGENFDQRYNGVYQRCQQPDNVAESVPDSSKLQISLNPQETSSMLQESLWEGEIELPNVAKFSACCKKIGGICQVEELTNLFTAFYDTLKIKGRIRTDSVWNYLKEHHELNSREMLALEFVPSPSIKNSMDKDDRLRGFKNIFDYFHLRNRCAVVAHDSALIKDIYLVPVAENQAVPQMVQLVKPLDNLAILSNEKRFVGLLVLTKRPQVTTRNKPHLQPEVSLDSLPSNLNTWHKNKSTNDKPKSNVEEQPAGYNNVAFKNIIDNLLRYPNQLPSTQQYNLAGSGSATLFNNQRPLNINNQQPRQVFTQNQWQYQHTDDTLYKEHRGGSGYKYQQNKTRGSWMPASGERRFRSRKGDRRRNRGKNRSGGSSIR